MKQAQIPCEKQIIQWLNDTLKAHIKPLSKLEDLKEGSAYLFLVSSIYPGIIDTAKIIIKPSSLWEVYMNYQLLARIFRKEKLSYAISIQKLAHPNAYEHFRLSIFLYELYKKSLNSSPKLKIQAKQIEISSAKTTNKLLAKKSAINQHTSPIQNDHRVYTSLSQSTQCKKQEIHQRALSINPQSQENGWCADGPQRTNYIAMNLITAKNLNETYFNTYKISKFSKMNFYSYLRKSTLEFLQNIELGLQKKQIINKCLSIHKSFRSISYLFQENEQTTEANRLTMQNIRQHCTRYYKSIEFVRTIIQNDLRKMKFKRMCIAYLPKIEQLPQSNWQRKQFQSINKQQLVIYFESKVSFYDQASTAQNQFSQIKLQQSTVDQHVNDAKYDDYYESSDDQDQNTGQFQRQDDRPYWTMHRITLIAYELRYVHKKDPNFLEEDQFFYKRSEHNKFLTGFQLIHLKDHKNIDVVSLAQTATYPHLAKLLSKQAKHSYGVAQLAEFVRIMLYLKHSLALPFFLDAYEAIIAAIQDVTFASIKRQKERSQIIEAITQKLATSATNIHKMLKQTLELQETENDANSLLRTTVYCFLAERFGFHINQFWPIAFPAWQKDKTPKKRKKKVQNDDKLIDIILL